MACIVTGAMRLGGLKTNINSKERIFGFALGLLPPKYILELRRSFSYGSCCWCIAVIALPYPVEFSFVINSPRQKVVLNTRICTWRARSKSQEYYYNIIEKSYFGQLTTHHVRIRIIDLNTFLSAVRKSYIASKLLL